MSPPAWAYQVEYFNPPPDEDLVCSICQSVFCDPVQSPCKHVFCRNCIMKWLEINSNCPICRKIITGYTLQEVVPIVKNIIMKLTLRCLNSERGCEEKFSLENCESHVKECPFELVQCKYKPCKMMFLKRDTADHEQSTCYYSYERCSICKLKMSVRNPQTHDCLEELQKKLKGAHYDVEEVIKCKYCSKLIIFSALEKHNSKCSGNPLARTGPNNFIDWD